MGTLLLDKHELAKPPPVADWGELIITGLAFYFLTSMVAVLGVELGHDFLQMPQHGLARRQDVAKAFANWDGEWYEKIVTRGYQYDPKRQSSVAFFPAFPVLGRLLAGTGLRADLALVLVAHACLAAAFVVLAAYVKQRFPDAPAELGPFVLLTFGLLPTTFFFRMAYSESLFVLVSILSLYGMERRWPLAAIACLVGLATATRSVGVALLVPLVLHVCKGSSHLPASTPLKDSGRATPRIRGLVRLVWLTPLACWGIIAYAVYLYFEFGAPLAFVQTQENWRIRPPVDLMTKIGDLATLEPVVANLNPSSPCYWCRAPGEVSAFFSLYLANPLYWVSAVGLVVLGACKRWLSTNEVALAVCLLVIPYGLRSHEMCMAGMGRFASVAFPMYLVLGHIFARLPALVAACLLGVSGFFLGAYAALFAAWYRFF
jgi:hypothetical protein